MDDFVVPPGLVGASGLVTLLLSVVVSIVRGWLVPARTVDALLAGRDARVQEAIDREQAWRDIAREKDATVSTLTAAVGELTAQYNDLLVTARASEALLRALPRPDGAPLLQALPTAAEGT